MKRKRYRGDDWSQILVVGFWFLVGFLLVGVLLFVLFSPNFISSNSPTDQQLELTAVNVTATESTLKSSATPTATPRITPPTLPPPTETPDGPLSLEQRLYASYDDVELAKKYMRSEKYIEAILIWDGVIASVPEFADAYYQRGSCYYQLLNNQRFLGEYRDNLNQGLADVDMAIKLGPPRGNYYVDRSYGYSLMANSEQFSVDGQLYRDRSFEDIVEALYLGNDLYQGNFSPFMEMIVNNRCSEALDSFLYLQTLQDPGAPKMSMFLRSIGNAYICLEQYGNALEYLEAAAEVQRGNGWYPEKEILRKVVVFHALGRYEEGLDLLNEYIERKPYYSGVRYYLRALLYYELGEPDLALEDLNFGVTQTWGKYHIRAYVMGLLALDQGDEAAALEWFQYAEASLNPSDYPLIYKRAVNQIARLGGSPLYPRATEIPENQRTPVPLVADQIYYTPTPPSKNKSISSTMYNYGGTGFIFFNTNESILFTFRPRGYPSLTNINTLKIKIDGFGNTGGLDMEYSLMALDGSGYSPAQPLTYGENLVGDPQKFVDDGGYFYLLIKNKSANVVVLENIRIWLEALDLEKQEVIYEYSN